MNAESVLKSRVLPIVVIDNADDAVPLGEALLAGGLACLEITLRTPAAAQSITRIRQALPHVTVGAGTLLSADDVRRAVDAGAQFGVSPGLTVSLSQAAQAARLPLFPGVATATDIMTAFDHGWHCLKFFPAEPCGGVKTLKALIGPFDHAGVRFVPTGGITSALLPSYLQLPQVAAVGGSWMAERRLIASKDWHQIANLATDAMRIINQAAEPGA